MKPIILTLALFAVACGGQKATESNSSSTSGSGTSSTSPDVPEKVLKAGAIAKAIDANPQNAEAILAENNMTAQQWADLLMEIAADPAWSAAYAKARGK